MHTTYFESFGSHLGNAARKFSDLAGIVDKHSHYYYYGAAWLS